MCYSIHSEQLNDLYVSPNFIPLIKWRMRLAGRVAGTGEMSDAYRVLVGKPEGERPLGRPRRRSNYNIKMKIQEVGCGCMNCIDLAQDSYRWGALVNAVMDLQLS